MATLSAADGVNNFGVTGTNVVDVNFEFASSGREKADQKHVGIVDHFVEQFGGTLGAEVHGDVALPAVEDFVHEGEATGAGRDPGIVQSAHWVTGGWFNLGNAGAPIGQYRPGRGNERPHRYFDNFDSFEPSLSHGFLAFVSVECVLERFMKATLWEALGTARIRPSFLKTFALLPRSEMARQPSGHPAALIESCPQPAHNVEIAPS